MSSSSRTNWSNRGDSGNDGGCGAAASGDPPIFKRWRLSQSRAASRKLGLPSECARSGAGPCRSACPGHGSAHAGNHTGVPSRSADMNLASLGMEVTPLPLDGALTRNAGGRWRHPQGLPLNGDLLDDAAQDWAANRSLVLVQGHDHLQRTGGSLPGRKGAWPGVGTVEGDPTE